MRNEMNVIIFPAVLNDVIWNPLTWL